jgi:hypothetical protein
MNESGWNMYVFRDGRRNVQGAQLTAEVQRSLQKLSMTQQEVTWLSALVSAGELECALADSGSVQAGTAASITDQLAAALMCGRNVDWRELASRVACIQVPETVWLAVAEGFAYYALHPFRFKEPVRQLANGAPVRVIGLRSIGTALSAVVQALFTASGSAAERITVRPHGHPYDRKAELSVDQVRWLHEEGDRATIVIVDEGPGLSGSSFLAVAEAVENSGIERSRIVILGSRYPDAAQLRAPDAAKRWPRYRFLAASSGPVLPEEAQIDLSGGLWRHHFLADFENQPAAWTHLEAAKYLSSDRASLFKFHGYGHFAESISRRAIALTEAGFAPRLSGLVRGFGRYEVEEGQILSANELTADVLQRMAVYCAFRSRELAVTEEGHSELENMARWNWQCEFDSEIAPLQLHTERLVIADARMLPHEWLCMEDGRILKLDGSMHGDDHFFPGSCDIAWDLAGTIVEWELNDSQSNAFLDTYRVASGDDAGSRIHEYVRAYSIFRMAWSKMAAQASAGSFDEKLLLRDYIRYRKQALAASCSKISAQQSDEPTAASLNSAIAV